MRIQHNIPAMNVARQLGIVNGRLTKNTERLSSGYRINCAADDAAGLSISEKMRKQIRGLMQGIANAEDGISLCQVADGALTEVHDMLQRMNELAVKSANGILSESDRKSTDDEVQMLKQEINRIGQTTKFNEIYIFNDGSLTTSTSGSASSSSGNKPLTEGRFFQLLGNNVSNNGYMDEPLLANTLTISNCTFDATHPALSQNPYVGIHVDFGSIEPNLKDLVGCQFYVSCCTGDCPKTVYFTDDIGITTTISEQIYTGYNYLSEIKIGMKKSDGSYYSDAEEFNKYIVNNLKSLINPDLNANALAAADHVQFAYQGKTLYLLDVDNKNWTPANKEAAYFCDSSNIFGPNSNSSTAIANKSQNSIWIQSGADAGDGMFLNIGSVSTASLGISNLDVSTERSATQAIDLVSNAISIVSAQRSRIGAYQNRLEHTIKNEENIVENTTAAESKIRDTDMAKEMLEYSKNQILMQVGQSLLAQANQTNQGILKLIGG